MTLLKIFPKDNLFLYHVPLAFNRRTRKNFNSWGKPDLWMLDHFPIFSEKYLKKKLLILSKNSNWDHSVVMSDRSNYSSFYSLIKCSLLKNHCTKKIQTTLKIFSLLLNNDLRNSEYFFCTTLELSELISLSINLVS